MMRKCKVYNCLRTLGGCCADCDVRYCVARCLNHPDRCNVWESEEARARRKRRSRVTPEEAARMVGLARTGLPYRQIAERTGFPLSTVQYTLGRMGYRRYEEADEHGR